MHFLLASVTWLAFLSCAKSAIKAHTLYQSISLLGIWTTCQKDLVSFFFVFIYFLDNLPIPVVVWLFSQFCPSYCLISISGFCGPDSQSTQYNVIPYPSGLDLGRYHGNIPHTLQKWRFAVFVPHSYNIDTSSRVAVLLSLLLLLEFCKSNVKSSSGIIICTFRLM